MTSSRILRASAVALTACLLGMMSLTATEKRSAQPAYIRIGMVGSLFRDISPGMMQVSLQPFSSLVRSQTGLDGRPVVGGKALELARQLQDDKVQFAVFHGFEFAWAQEKFPELRPLVIAINRHRQLRAMIVTRYDNAAKGLEDFKGKKLALPQRSREHCHLYLEKFCRGCGSTPREFFEVVVTHPNPEEALDDVLRKKVDVAVVDGVSLECYQRTKPGCHSGLKIVQQSPVFPAAVVAYRQGALDPAILTQFRDGMIRANQSPNSRDLMLMWRMTAFEAVPADFQRILTSIRKEFPCPEER
jgi:ABC-type phosphate/phosphonate transport system substrate-binding protein